jgi:hypothetical protein
VLAAGETKRIELRLEDVPLAAPAVVTPAVAPVPAVVPAPEDAPGRGLRIGGLVVAGLGIVAAGLGIKYGLDASDASDRSKQVVADAQRTGSWEGNVSRLHDAQSQADSAERNMWILYGVGGAMLVTGGVLYYLGHRRSTASERRVDVVPGIASMTLRGRF